MEYAVSKSVTKVISTEYTSNMPVTRVMRMEYAGSKSLKTVTSTEHASSMSNKYGRCE